MTLDDAVLRLDAVVVPPSLRIIGAISRLDAAGTGALLVCDADFRFLGLVTDGDIRRAILRGVSLQDSVRTIATTEPVIGAPDVSERAALRLMDEAMGFAVDQLPLVDANGRAVGLLLRRDLITQERLSLSALIMAGGLGTRMLPLTEHLPKPMLPIGDRPLLERTIQSLQRAGIKRVSISTMHLADCISSHFGDGRDHAVDIQYVTETQPLGTAGALRLVDDPGTSLLVVNGDILTSVRYEDMMAYHRRENAELTVGIRRCELELPYGILECDGPRVRAVREKPRQSFWANAGIYIVQPSVRDLIPPNTRFDMTDLMERMLADGRPVAGFPILEYWLDIGHPADYMRAQADMVESQAVP